MDKLLKRLSKKTNLSIDFIKDVWVIEYSHKHFSKELKLTSIDINIEPKSKKLLEKLSKQLKVSESALVQQALTEQMK